jgi:hypothetical protein
MVPFRLRVSCASFELNGALHGVSAVHGFAQEVAACLLRRGDVDLGELREGVFASWSLEPEDVDTKVDEELMSVDAFLVDETRYVFTKKHFKSESSASH